jgi:hypothetical protein
MPIIPQSSSQVEKTEKRVSELLQTNNLARINEELTKKIMSNRTRNMSD